jgi:hypothetical protein
MIIDGQPLSVAALSRNAGVSRSWLYTQQALLEKLASQNSRQEAPAPRPTRAASDASLLQRLSLAHERNQALSAEIRQLRDQLATAYGQLRAARLERGTG